MIAIIKAMFGKQDAKKKVINKLERDMANYPSIYNYTGHDSMIAYPRY